MQDIMVCIPSAASEDKTNNFSGSTNFGVGLSLLIANPVSGIMLEKVGAKPLAFFYLGIVVLAGVSITVARGLLLSSFTTLRARI